MQATSTLTNTPVSIFAEDFDPRLDSIFDDEFASIGHLVRKACAASPALDPREAYATDPFTKESLVRGAVDWVTKAIANENTSTEACFCLVRANAALYAAWARII
jgi:hypothetical protein